MIEQFVEYYPVGWNLYCYLVSPRLWLVANGRPRCAMNGCMWPALCCDWLRVEHPTLWLVAHSSETLGVKAADFHFLYIFYGLYVMWLCVQQKKCSHAPIKNQSSLNIVSPSFNLRKAHQLQEQCMYTKHSIHLPGPPGTHLTPQRSPTDSSEPSTAGFLNLFYAGTPKQIVWSSEAVPYRSPTGPHRTPPDRAPPGQWYYFMHK